MVRCLKEGQWFTQVLDFENMSVITSVLIFGAIIHIMVSHIQRLSSLFDVSPVEDALIVDQIEGIITLNKSTNFSGFENVGIM